MSILGHASHEKEIQGEKDKRNTMECTFPETSNGEELGGVGEFGQESLREGRVKSLELVVTPSGWLWESGRRGPSVLEDQTHDGSIQS